MTTTKAIKLLMCFQHVVSNCPAGTTVFYIKNKKKAIIFQYSLARTGNFEYFFSFSSS